MYHGERFNSISHLVGAALSLVAASVLVTLAAMNGDPWRLMSAVIYGGISVLLFVISTLYHSLQGKPKQIFRKLDHVAIYLMIAGTYTPFTLVKLRAGHGWGIFLTIWAMALFGSVQELTRGLRTRSWSFVIYVAMTGVICLFIRELWDALSAGALIWLGTGVSLFGVGALFYAYDSRTRHLPDRWAYAHGIWHLFVILGFFCQYMSVSLSIVS